MSGLFTSLPFLLCLIWIFVLGTSARNNRDDSDTLLEVLESLLRNKVVYDVRDVNTKKQTTSGISRKFGSDVRNAERNDIGGEKIVETDMRKDVNEENDLLLRDIEAFLNLKRKSQKKWLDNDPSLRGTNTTSTSTSTSTTGPPSTQVSTTPAPTARPKTCRRICFWWRCYNFCY